MASRCRSSPRHILNGRLATAEIGAAGGSGQRTASLGTTAGERLGDGLKIVDAKRG
jgi:hypothetical protein